MKKVIRFILFVKRKIYIYPYSEKNLDNDLTQIAYDKYFNLKNDLRCKIVNNLQFDIWEKWNYGIGTRGLFHMSSGNAYFSGTKIFRDGRMIIEGLIFPNPFGTIISYMGIFILLLSLLFHDYSEISLNDFKFQIIFLSILIGMIFISIYFRKRVERKVEEILNLKKYHNKV